MATLVYEDFPGDTTEYNVNFEYLDKSDVYVGQIDETENLTSITTGWTWKDDTTIEFTEAPGGTIRVYRVTDVDEPIATFYPTVAIRAIDLNNNFDQCLFRLQELNSGVDDITQDIDNIREDLEDLEDLISNSLQYEPVANVAELNAKAATDPDNLKGYEIQDSTDIDTLANPIIVGLPPTAGGDVGEDPVNGVYWNDGIVTRVQWQKTTQNWRFNFYYAKNGDNRYQQQTLAAPITPNPSDYKDGTLWFDSGDANLYVLYNDGESRQWVITNPLSAYGQIVTSDDVFWSRFAGENRVYPKNSSDSIGNDSAGSNWEITADGSAKFASNVGIGTTSPVERLVVKGSAEAGYPAQFTDSSESNFAKIYVDPNGIGFVKNNFDDGIEFASNTARIYANGSERLRIDSSGNVGIGTDSPNSYGGAVKLAVASSDNTSLSIVSGTDGDGTLLFADGTSGDETYRGQVQYLHSSDVMLFNTAAAERMRIDSSGRLLVATTSARTDFNNGSQTAQIQLEGTSADTSNLALVRNSANTGTASLIFGKSRASGDGGVTVVNSGDTLGSIDFEGADGTDLVRAALIRCEVDGTPGSNDMPGRLVFSTTADGESDPTERMRIDSSGRLLVGTTTEGAANADNLTVADSGHAGITIRSGTSSKGAIFFSDATSGSGEFEGVVEYNHSDNNMLFFTSGSGRLLVGTTSAPSSYAGQYPNLLVKSFAGTSIGDGSLGLMRGENAADITTGDDIGTLMFVEQGGGAYAWIKAEADGASGVGSFPGRLVFSTTADGESAPSERMRIDSSGSATFAGGNITLNAGGFYTSESSYGHVNLNVQSGALLASPVCSR